MGDKRKMIVVAIEDKLRAIYRLHSGATEETIASELGVDESTVNDWKENLEEIDKWCAAQASGSGVKRRKTIIGGRYKEVEKALFLWYKHLQTKKWLAVTGSILQEKTLQFSRILKNRKF